MDVDSQRVIEDLLEQNKQMALQLAVARAAIAQLKEIIESMHSHEEDTKKS